MGNWSLILVRSHVSGVLPEGREAEVSTYLSIHASWTVAGGWAGALLLLMCLIPTAREKHQTHKKMQQLAAKDGTDGKHLRATNSKMLPPRCRLFIWEAIPGRTLKERGKRERGKEGAPIQGVP